MAASLCSSSLRCPCTSLEGSQRLQHDDHFCLSRDNQVAITGSHGLVLHDLHFCWKNWQNTTSWCAEVRMFARWAQGESNKDLTSAVADWVDLGSGRRSRCRPSRMLARP